MCVGFKKYNVSRVGAIFRKFKTTGSRRPFDGTLHDRPPVVIECDEIKTGDAPGKLRAASGRDVVLVSRVRRDPSAEPGLLLWLACDTLRLAADNAVRLAVSRFGQLH